MKRILTCIITLLLLGSGITGWGQNFSDKFLEQIPKKIVSVATVNSSMIEALKKGETNEKLLSFLNELSFLRIITVDKQSKRVITINTTPDANYYCDMAMTLARQYGKGEELLGITNGEHQTSLVVFNKTADNKAGEIVFINCDEDMLTIVNIMGNISIGNLGQLSKLSKSFKNL